MRGLAVDHRHGIAPASMGSWTRGAGVVYDPVTDVCSLGTLGTGPISVKVPTLGAASLSFRLTCYSDIESPRWPGTGNADAYVTTIYYAQDKTTLANNTAATPTPGNGNANLPYPLGEWTEVGSTLLLGPDIAWVQFSCNVSALYQTKYQIKNIRLTLA